MYRAIAKNKRNTVLIIAFFLLLLAAIGWFAGAMYNSPSITVAIIVGAGLYALFQYFLASKQALAISGATPIEKRDNPRLYRIVENLAITTGSPMPKVYVIEDPAPNAFATGRNPENASVAATTGLMEIMTDAELEGVMAHELGHVRNYDIRVSMIVFGLVVAVGIVADILLRLTIFGGGRNNNQNPIMLVIGIVAMLLAPLVATLVQLAVSRQREYLADATGALTTRHPEALASALTKLGEHAKPMRRQNSSMAHLWIADPLKPGVVDRMFQTHPPIADRVERLRSMGGSF